VSRRLHELGRSIFGSRVQNDGSGAACRIRGAEVGNFGHFVLRKLTALSATIVSTLLFEVIDAT
jgi:hypothetical protein